MDAATAAERRAVVAYLRYEAAHERDQAVANFGKQLASAIERGEHRLGGAR